MLIKRFKKINFKDYTLTQLQENIAQLFDSITLIRILNGNLLRDVELQIGDNLIEHKLNRDLIGWIVTRKNVVANIYDKQNSTPRPELLLTLNSDAVASVDVWVF